MIELYLQHYAEPVAQSLATGNEPSTIGLETTLSRDHIWQGCLVIPAFDEDFERFRQQLEALAAEDLLIIVVVNAPANADGPALVRTEELHQQLQQQMFPHVLVIDHVSQGRKLNPKQGVGLARKIGCDIALALLHLGRVRSPWILQSDADVAFPNGYTLLQQDAFKDDGAGAKIFPHRHYSNDPTLNFAAQLYDQHMSHYVAGLAAAGSRYAHHSLGSTIALHAQTYAAVRGYPRRSAGEDFYLLNKIRKIARIDRLPEPTLEIEARLSTRVPFGTGPALRQIIQNLAEDPSGRTYLSYHPKCFLLLGRAIETLEKWAVESSTVLDEDISRRLTALGFQRFVENLGKQNPSSNQRLKSAHDWFDGLKTLQFVHGCQKDWPDLPLIPHRLNN